MDAEKENQRAGVSAEPDIHLCENTFLIAPAAPPRHLCVAVASLKFIIFCST